MCLKWVFRAHLIGFMLQVVSAGNFRLSAMSTSMLTDLGLVK